MTTEIISTEEVKRGELFDLRMQLVEASFAEASRHQSAGWWALWECYADGSWRTRYANIRDWLGDLAVHHSISKGDFFETMRMVKNLRALEVDEVLIRKLLGKPMTALKGDFAKLMRQGQLLPDAQAHIEAEYGTPALFVEAVANADRGVARALVSRIREKDALFWLEEPIVTSAAILANLRWDNETGLQGIYTVNITVRNITEGQVIKDVRHLPDTVARWLLARLGLDQQET